MITKNSFVKFQNLVVNHESRLVKSNSGISHWKFILIITEYLYKMHKKNTMYAHYMRWRIWHVVGDMDKFEVEDGEYRWRGMSDMDVGDWCVWGVGNMDGKRNITYFLKYSDKFRNGEVLFLYQLFVKFSTLCYEFYNFLKKIATKIYYFIRHDHEHIGFQKPVER